MGTESLTSDHTCTQTHGASLATNLPCLRRTAQVQGGGELLSSGREEPGPGQLRHHHEVYCFMNVGAFYNVVILSVQAPRAFLLLIEEINNLL